MQFFNCCPNRYNRNCEGMMQVPSADLDGPQVITCPECGRQVTVNCFGHLDGIKANKKIKGSIHTKGLVWPYGAEFVGTKHDPAVYLNAAKPSKRKAS